MELGLYTFGDIVTNPKSGTRATARERMRQMLEMAKFADAASLDVFNVGEHHGATFVNSATAVTLAAMAAVTKRVRLTSAVTLLSTADPVRTYQEFATADLVSDGRIELIFGRGAFTDNFPLFGFDLSVIIFPKNALAILLAVFAGEFLYLGAASLLPENQEQSIPRIAVATTLGFLFIFIITMFL